jgi:hypothetical protein
MQYRWVNCVKGFHMKIKVYFNGEMHWLEPTQRWQNLTKKEPIRSVEVDHDFYVASFLCSEIQASDQSSDDKR